MLVDELARNASLDNDYGTTRGPNAADSHEVALLDTDGLEVDSTTAPGYARATVVPADWPPAEEGQKTVVVTFAAPTDEWTPVAGWQLIDPATGAVWDDGDLVDLLLVTSASDDGPTVVVTVAYQLDL